MFSRFDDSYRCGGPEIVLLAPCALGVQLIVLSLELQGDIVFFLVRDHEIQVLTTSAADKGRFARIQSQNVHGCAAIWMREKTARLLT